jgi:hypothetical protein
LEKAEYDFTPSFPVASSTSQGLRFDPLLLEVGFVVGEARLGGFYCGDFDVPFRSYQQYLFSLPLSRTNAKGHLDYDKKKTTINEEKY